MTDKELRHLNRSELLQMLITQGEENRKLKEQLEQANKKLEQREIMIANAGSIAEAALQLNGIFEAAQQAAQQYLDSIKAQPNGVDIASNVSTGAVISTPAVPVVSTNPVAPIGKTDDMNNDDYWKQVRKRAQMILGIQS